MRAASFGYLRHLALPAPRDGGKWIYGAWFVHARLVRELCREGLLDSLDLFAPTGRVQATSLFGHPCREVPFTDFPAEARARRYDLLLSYFGWNSGLPSLRATLLPRASLVQLVHSTHYERTLWDFGCQLSWRLFKPYDAIVCSSPTAVRTVKNMVTYWQERAAPLWGPGATSPGMVITIPYGTELPTRPPDRSAARASLGWTPRERIILVVARFSSFDKMDHAVVLSVFRRVANRAGRPVKLVCAGEDSQGVAKQLTGIAATMGVARSVRVYPNVDFETRDRLYAAADIFLSPVDHLQETFGLTVLEAMAHGLPVVASDWGGYRDLVEPGRTGFLIPTVWGGRLDDFGMMASFDAMTAAYAVARRTAVDPAEMERCLVALLRNERLARAMGRAGRERVLKEFTWPTVMARYRNLWNELDTLRRHARPSPRTLPGPRGHDYARLFGHYPGRRVDGKDRVVLRIPLREALRTSPVFLLSYEEEQRAVRAILQALDGAPQTVGECLRRAADRLSLAVGKVEDHLMLAAKYGLIEIRPGSD